jgi:hypothetical protein
MSLVVLASSLTAAEQAAERLSREGFSAEAGTVGGASFVLVTGEGVDTAVAVEHVRRGDPGCRPVTAW